jgi:hypothetical protein
MTITRVGPLSCAKIAGLLYVILGLIFGAFISLAAMVGAFASDSDGAGAFGALFGVGAIILVPLFYGCIGFVMTLIMAALFNLAAGMVGGLEVDAK